MYRYRPRTRPDPALWLSLDEQDRISSVEAFHRSERIQLPNLTAHAIFHVFVENQIAEEHGPVVHAMQRLVDEGLSRHESLHAVAWVLSQELHHAAQVATVEPVAGKVDVQPRYDAALERLSAASWRAQADGDDET